MSRLTVRRLTAAIALLAVLCLAMPAMAAPPVPSHGAKAPAVSLLDQFLTWLGSFLPGQPPQAPQVKTTSVGVSPSGASLAVTSDASNTIDPNGKW